MVILGLEYYTFSTRKIASVKIKKVGGFIINQLAILFLMLLIFILIFGFIINYQQNFKLSLYIVIFYIISEQLIRDIMRILISRNMQIQSSFVQMFYSLIPVLIVLLIFLKNYKLDLLRVFEILSLSNLLISLFCFYLYRNMFFPIRFSINLIYRGVKTSWKYVFISFSNRITTNFDKIVLLNVVPANILGAYSFLMSMGNMLNVIIDSLVISFAFPKLARLHYRGHSKKFKEKYYNYFKELILYILLTIILICVFWLVDFKSFRSIMDNDLVLIFAIIFFITNSINIFLQTNLYSRKLDNLILFSTIPLFLLLSIKFFIDMFNFDSILIIVLLFFSISNLISIIIKIYYQIELPKILQ